MPFYLVRRMEMILSEESASFMHAVFSNVWIRLADQGIDYTYEEMQKHFRDMMKDGSIQIKVEDFFVDRFTKEEGII